MREVSGRRGKAAILVLVLLVLGAAAFAAWYFLIRGSNPTDPMRRLIPARAKTVAVLDLARAFDTPLAKEAFGADRATAVPVPEPIASVLEAGGVDLRGVTRIALGLEGMGPLSGAGGAPQFLAAFEADMEPQAVQHALTALAGATERPTGGVNVVDAMFGSFAVAGDEALLYGTRAMVDASVALTGGQGKAAVDEPQLVELRAAVDGEAAFWAATTELALFSLLPPVPGLGDIRKTSHFALSVDLRDGLTLRVAVLMPTEGAARSARDVVNAAVGVVKLKRAISEGGVLEQALDLLTLEVKGRALIGVVRTSGERARDLLRTLRAMLPG